MGISNIALSREEDQETQEDISNALLIKDQLRKQFI